MLRILKVLIFLGLVAFVALTGFAYFGDLTPRREDVTLPVQLEVK